MQSIIYFHTELHSAAIRLYRESGGLVYRWAPGMVMGSNPVKGRWVLSVHSQQSFQSMVAQGVIIPATKWMRRIYGLPIGTPVTVPDCYSLRALVEKYPPRTKVTFKEIKHD